MTTPLILPNRHLVGHTRVDLRLAMWRRPLGFAATVPFLPVHAEAPTIAIAMAAIKASTADYLAAHGMHGLPLVGDVDARSLVMSMEGPTDGDPLARAKVELHRREREALLDRARRLTEQEPGTPWSAEDAATVRDLLAQAAPTR